MKSAILPKFAMFSAVSNSSSRAKPDRPAMGFKCNRCFVTVPKIGYITLCGHFFCHRCSNTWFSEHQHCPALDCRAKLRRSDDIWQFSFEQKLDENAAVKLWGHKPSEIMDVCKSAMGFWEQQKTLEISYRQKQVRQKDNKNRQFVEQANQKLSKAQDIITKQRNKLRKMTQDLKDKTEEVTKLMEQLRERSRQRDNLQKMYQRERGRQRQAIELPQGQSVVLGRSPRAGSAPKTSTPTFVKPLLPKAQRRGSFSKPSSNYDSQSSLPNAMPTSGTRLYHHVSPGITTRRRGRSSPRLTAVRQPGTGRKQFD
ncbi:hypothetical protein AAMO2058_001382700 [Amorphochlora amoebiformis]